MKQFGLSTAGDRDALVWRHQCYIDLYNASVDSLLPMEVTAIRERVAAAERERNSDRAAAASVQRSSVTSSSSAAATASGALNGPYKGPPVAITHAMKRRWQDLTREALERKQRAATGTATATATVTDSALGDEAGASQESGSGRKRARMAGVASSARESVARRASPRRAVLTAVPVPVDAPAVAAGKTDGSDVEFILIDD